MLSGGAPDSDIAVLTLTYNPLESAIPKQWEKQTFALTNDDKTGNSLCMRQGSLLRGCWLVEDAVATEEQIRYVLANLRETRILASYPVVDTRQVCLDVPALVSPAPCVRFANSVYPIPSGHVGGYFDGVKIDRRSPGL